MNATYRILSPAIVSACLAFPLFAEHEKKDAAGEVHANIPDRVLAGEHRDKPVGESSRYSSLGHVVRASDLMKLEVRNLQDEKLGKVNDLGVDVGSGRIVQVIVSTGGVLGVGSSYVAVPPAALHYDETANVLHLDTTKEALKNAPSFDLTQWKTHFEPNQVDQVYRHYGVAPYFTPETPAADNTARNERDQKGTTLTPLDQGSSSADVALTKQIRKDVLAREELSVTAKNVKIITVNGHVTLRGPVNNEEEKRVIGELAANVAKPGNVDNQLEVKREVTRN